jgi:hypothetical protein
LNSAYRVFFKGDSSETHFSSDCGSALSVGCFRRAASFDAGSVEQPIHTACVKTSPQPPPFKEAQRRETPAHRASATIVTARTQLPLRDGKIKREQRRTSPTTQGVRIAKTERALDEGPLFSFAASLGEQI